MQSSSSEARELEKMRSLKAEQKGERSRQAEKNSLSGPLAKGHLDKLVRNPRQQQRCMDHNVLSFQINGLALNLSQSKKEKSAAVQREGKKGGK
ncbi:hypothetical protein E2320_011717 [Naja naja]|nr:hypothetical protein E2320_011717 [Naja naja]